MEDLLLLDDFDLIENFENILLENVDFDQNNEEINIGLNIEIDVPEYLSDMPAGNPKSTLSKISDSIFNQARRKLEDISIIPGGDIDKFDFDEDERLLNFE